MPLKEDVNSHTPEEKVSKDVACTKPSVGDCFVIGGITKQSPTEGLVQASKDDANNCWREAGAEDLTDLLQLGGRNILHLSSGMTSSLLTLLSTLLLSLACLICCLMGD